MRRYQVLRVDGFWYVRDRLTDHRYPAGDTKDKALFLRDLYSSYDRRGLEPKAQPER